MSLSLDQIADLAKQGGRLANDKQWVLADALADLTETEIATIAIRSKRNESTLLQYARAAQRWSPLDRVDGVSFSAHRVALSWHDPRSLLVDLKHKFGSPTVRQVRQAMGLEGHPAIELIERGIRKLDRKVSAKALASAVNDLHEFLRTLDVSIGDVEVPEEDEPEFIDVEVEQTEEERYEEVREDTQVTVVDPADSGKWQPPIRTTDIAGI